MLFASQFAVNQKYNDNLNIIKVICIRAKMRKYSNLFRQIKLPAAKSFNRREYE